MQRFHSVCVELRQALNREQEAQTLIQEQTDRLHALQLRADTHTSELTNTQHTLTQTTQVHVQIHLHLSDASAPTQINQIHLNNLKMPDC